jgi:hypothetical protein
MNAVLKLLPEPTKDQTAERAMRTLAALGVDRSKISYDVEDFQLRVDGHRIWLGNLQAQCRHVWPWQRASVTREFLASLLKMPARPATIEEARPSLLPGVRDSFMFETLRLQSTIEGLKSHGPSGYALGSRLWLAAFLDYPTSTSVVTVSDLEAWGASSEQCLAPALENLAARSQAGMVRIAEGVYHSPWQDCYDPARILLRDVIGQLDIKGDPVAFAPNWNHLLLTGSEDQEGLAACLLFAMRVLAEEPRPITALPLVRRSGEWVDFELPKGHVVEPLLCKARVQELNQIYVEQAAFMDRVHAKHGTDIFVAKYNATRNERAEQYDSYAVWSKAVATLLPKTERVVFFDADQPEKSKIVAAVDWPIVVLHCAHQMKDSGLTPPRYLVETFPEAGQLEAMRAAQTARSAAGPPTRTRLA